MGRGPQRQSRGSTPCVLAGGHSQDMCTACHTNATCDEKVDGSGKVCNCKYGFVGNGRTICLDKDECQIGANRICGQSTTCHNTYGSYYCTCMSGYSPSNNMAVFIPNDGTHCQDDDECRIPGLCGDGAQCTNLPGSFECSCQLGYRVQNGKEPFNPRRENASCKEVDCGPPPHPPHTHMVWNKSSRVGAEVFYQCNYGYHNVGEGNVSVCAAAGLWEKPSVVCQETSCGSPPVIESTEQMWNNNSTPGSTVLYFCKEGFHKKGGENVSVCNEKGQWSIPSLVCKGIHDIFLSSLLQNDVGKREENKFENTSSTFFHTLSLSDNFSSSLYRGHQSRCKIILFPPQRYLVSCSPLAPHPKSSPSSALLMSKLIQTLHLFLRSLIHVLMCVQTFEMRGGKGKLTFVRLVEIKPPITQLLIFNESCLRWRAEKYEAATEVYKVTYTGRRDYQRYFYDSRKRFLSSTADRLELCLNLLPVTNYSIAVTALTVGFTATVTTNTSLPGITIQPDPTVPFETPVPTLKLRRSVSSLDAISFYQVFVLPAEGIVVFDCSDPSSDLKSSSLYIAAQINAKHVGTEMNFTVGDGLCYGGFLNVPLKNGRDYYIFLRAEANCGILSVNLRWMTLKYLCFFLFVGFFLLFYKTIIKSKESFKQG
uniref:Sushi domain containing 1 n=1 Tax=Takifugu rubripes TaxID=31033 RepID=H2UPV8_TAKRU